MKLKIADISVSDRIRKDYGNLDELAESIRSTGWIQPILVTPNNELIAGERRLRACRDILGMEEIPVQVADVRDAEHQLELEIVENGVRKNWTMTEMLEIARRKERLAAIRAKEKERERKTTLANSPKSESVNSRQEAAATIGVGENTYQRMKHIEDHKDLLTPSDFVDWDEGRLSTNKAYQRIKAQLEAERKRNSELNASIGAMQQQLDNVDYDNDDLQKLIDANTELQNDVDNITTRLNVANQQIENMRGENAELQEQLENQPVKIETRTVYPADYDENKRKVDKLQKELDDTIKVNSKLQSAYADILKRNAAYQDTTLPETYDKGLIADAELFLVVVQRFSKDISGARYVSHHMDQVKEYSPTLWNNFSKAWEEIYAMAQLTCNYIQNINNPKLDS